MTGVRLRILKRYTSLEAESAEVFYRTEFMDRETGRPDLELSVFDVQVDRVVQAHAEFAGTYRSPESQNRGGVNLDGCSNCSVVETEGDTAFEYTRKSHRELRFLRASELEETARAAFRELTLRTHSVLMEELRKYISSRLQVFDEEWVLLCTSKPKWKKWATASPPQPGPETKGDGKLSANTKEEKLPDMRTTTDGGVEHKEAATSTNSIDAADSECAPQRKSDAPPGL
jgi:hypothetical protein